MEGFSEEKHAGFVTDCRVEKRARARSYCLNNEAQSIEWRTVVSGGDDVFGTPCWSVFVFSLTYGTYIQSVPLVGGSR